jgi:hypothetical protein
MKQTPKPNPMSNDLITVTDLYFPREDGSVTHVRLVGKVVVSVKDNAAVILFPPNSGIRWPGQESWYGSRELALLYDNPALPMG